MLHRVRPLVFGVFGEVLMDSINFVPSSKINEQTECSHNVETLILVTKYRVTAMRTRNLIKVNWKKIAIYTRGMFYRYENVRNVYWECFSAIFNNIDVKRTRNGQTDKHAPQNNFLRVNDGSRIVNQLQAVRQFVSSKTRLAVECWYESVTYRQFDPSHNCH